MNLYKLLQESNESLSKSECSVFDYLTSQSAFEDITIQMLANKCHVSVATVYRFCKKIGLDGYSELRAIMKYSKNDSTTFSKENFQRVYRQVVKYINQYDTSKLFLRIDKVSTLFIFAETELELRLARNIQRIFLPLNKEIYILPNQNALINSQEDIVDQLCIIIELDSNHSNFVGVKHISIKENTYIVLLSNFKSPQISVDDHFLIPKVVSNKVIPIEHITPYTLAIELLYLKYQLK